MQLVPATFTGPGQDGDFKWMADQPAYARALFIFNDNAEQFLAFQSGQRDHGACAPGGGNAVVRPLQCENPPRAAGIPTGGGGEGYASLDDEAKGMIEHALTHVTRLIESGRYDQVIYSCAKGDPDMLGTGIFRVGDDVARYIPARLKEIFAGVTGTEA